LASPQASDGDDAGRIRLGIAFGVAQTVGAALCFVFSRGGVLAGFRPEDITLLRFLGAALVFLPLLLHRGSRAGLAAIGWRRALILTLVAGPVFTYVQTAGYLFAPLAHGAVLAPMSVTLFSMAMALVLLGERYGLAHALGTAGILLGLLLVGGEGLSTGGGERVWLGDLLFIGCGAMWAGYTILLRQWRLDAVAATAAVTLIGLVVSVPAWLLISPPGHALSLPPGEVAIQAVIQGVVSGALAMIAYSRAVEYLGAGRAVLFPALVPGLTIVFGIPLLGELPTLVQLLGLAAASLGLAVALGILRLPRSGRL